MRSSFRTATEAARARVLADLSACQIDFAAARERIAETSISNPNVVSAALSSALSEAQGSIEAAADRLRQRLPAVPPRKGGRDSTVTADKRLVKICKSKVDAFVAMVEQACAPNQCAQVAVAQRQADRRRPGDRLVMQARALRRAMLGPTGIAGQGRRGDGSAFRAALERLDAALAEADRLGADTDIVEAPGKKHGDTSYDAFTKAAQKASHAAQELQRAGEELKRAGEARFDEAAARADGARALVRIALGELTEIEGDVQMSGVDVERSVLASLREARRVLEKMALTLGDGDGDSTGSASSTGRGEHRVEVLVANGKLEAALATVDAARAQVARIRRVSDVEGKARVVLVEASGRVQELSREAEEAGLLGRPAVAQALQGCRSSATAAERYDNRVRIVSSDKREALAQDYMTAAVHAADEVTRAEEILRTERVSASRNDHERTHLMTRLEPARTTLSRLRSRLDELSVAAEKRCASLEGVRSLAASWEMGSVGDGPRGPLRDDRDGGVTAARAVADAAAGVNALVREVENSWNVGVLGKDVEICVQRVALAEVAVAEADVRGRRKGNAFAALDRAAKKVQSVIDDSRAAKVTRRLAVAEPLARAAGDVRAGLVIAAQTLRMSIPPGSSNEADSDAPLLAAAGHAEETAESAAVALAKERLDVEQAERERQQSSSELWTAARQLEKLDTGGVVGDDPEAAAMVLEARSQAVQVRSRFIVLSIIPRMCCWCYRPGRRLYRCAPDL